MYELPLFPLNTVLFPGMPLELHIFEERYKLMIGQCIDQNKPFGVALIRTGRVEHGILPDPYRVGCAAHISRVQPLWQGRMNILAIGRERFRIISLDRTRPYLVGMVESFPLIGLEQSVVTQSSRRLRRLVERFLEIMKDTGQLRFKSHQPLPRNPLSLAFLAAVLLHLPPAHQQTLLAHVVSSQTTTAPGPLVFKTFVAQQQALLEIESASTLLDDLCVIYRREVALLRSTGIAADHKDETPLRFSDN